jgi:hypothetical protein
MRRRDGVEVEGSAEDEAELEVEAALLVVVQSGSRSNLHACGTLAR